MFCCLPQQHGLASYLPCLCNLLVLPTMLTMQGLAYTLPLCPAPLLASLLACTMGAAAALHCYAST